MPLGRSSLGTLRDNDLVTVPIDFTILLFSVYSMRVERELARYINSRGARTCKVVRRYRELSSVRVSISFGERWNGRGLMVERTFESRLVGLRSPLVSPQIRTVVVPQE